MRVEEFQGGFVELVGLVDERSSLVVKRLPRCIERVGHHHLFFEQFARLLQRGLTNVSRSAERFVRGFARAEGVLQFQGVFGLELFDLHQQLVKTGARRTVEETLPQRIRAHGPSFTEGLRHSGRDQGNEFAELTDVALVVAAQTGLTGNDLAENLRTGQQFADQRTFALQGVFRLLGLERSNHFIALAVERLDLFRVVGHCRQAFQACQYGLFESGDLRFDIASLAGLAEGDVDLHQIVQGFQIAAQAQAAAEQIKALQLDPGALEFTIGIAHQIEIGHQHRHQKQHADQAELHAEAQTIHQRDGGIEQALHWKSPLVFLVFIGRRAGTADSHYRAPSLYSSNRREVL